MNNEGLQQELEQLQQENQQLKEALDKKEKASSSIKGKNLAQIVWRSFVSGKKLDKSLNEIISEYNTGFIKQTTAVSVITAAFRRIYRVSIPFLLLAILPSIFVLIQTFLLRKQNDLITKQNERIDYQIQLSEAERRSALVFLLGNVMDAIVDDTKNGNQDLSPTVIGQIISISRAFKPYRYMEDDKLLEEPLSPERGQLLITLIESNLSNRTYEQIFSRGDFTYADLAGATLNKAYLRGISLNNANLAGASLNNANLSQATLHGVNFAYSVFYNTDLRRTDLLGANLSNTTLSRANLSGADLEGTNLNNIDLTGAKVDVSNWIERLEKQDQPPQGIETLKEKFIVNSNAINGNYLIEAR